MLKFTSSKMSAYQIDPVLEEVKINIRALITSYKADMTYEALINEYEDLFCEPMPLCGFKTRVDLIHSIPDVIVVIRGTPNRLRLVHSQMSGHVARLVNQQKPPRREAKRFPSTSHLLSKGIHLPKPNVISVQNKSKTKTVIRNEDVSQYKWPPVSDLFGDKNKKDVNKQRDECDNKYPEVDENKKNEEKLSLQSCEEIELQSNSRGSQELSCKSTTNSSGMSQSSLTSKVKAEIIRNNFDVCFMDL